eukprot:CAMPEP_0115225446 /NCGR_PEP_ID=MMETSP0270-20121206/30111_1 /TAXON_ID=71861 /ORGANISM="Scrippsiella trochoidea, Strain CCMP3099" /LENGTH=158 /DNA_ID=CAMNT_0002639821 /DNA_START=195 /DNA_END=669 /DNA_ORIENTATION=+
MASPIFCDGDAAVVAAYPTAPKIRKPALPSTAGLQLKQPRPAAAPDKVTEVLTCCGELQASAAQTKLSLQVLSMYDAYWLLASQYPMLAQCEQCESESAQAPLPPPPVPPLPPLLPPHKLQLSLQLSSIHVAYSLEASQYPAWAQPWQFDWESSQAPP